MVGGVLEVDLMLREGKGGLREGKFWMRDEMNGRGR